MADKLAAEYIPTLALTPDQAAAALSMSRDSFDRYVRDEIKMVRRGRLTIVPFTELVKWLETNAAVTLEVDK